MRLIATGITLALALLLTGCTDDAEPNAEPQAQASASERPVSPPERPEAAKGNDADAAAAFVEFYIDSLNYATEWGDTSALSDVESDDCTVCLEIRDGIEKAYAAEVEDELPQWQVTKIDEATHEDMFEVFATVTDADDTALQLSFDISRESPFTILQIYDLTGGPVELLGDRTL